MRLLLDDEVDEGGDDRGEDDGDEAIDDALHWCELGPFDETLVHGVELCVVLFHKLLRLLDLVLGLFKQYLEACLTSDIDLALGCDVAVASLRHGLVAPGD